MTVHPSAPQATKVPEDVNQMQAALYFKNADRFGDWRIIIGTDATKKLRELANGDRKKCVIVVKKIKYVVCMSLLGELTIAIGNFRTGIFQMKIRKG